MTQPAIQTTHSMIASDSHLRFSAVQEGDAFTGEFTAFDAAIRYDATAPQDAAVRVTIPLASVSAGSNDRDGTLPGEVWFNRKAFPTATFRADGFTPQADGSFVTDGTLTLKGVSADVRLPFTLTKDGERIVMSGRTTIDRTDWSVGEAPWDTDEWVSRAVELDVRVVAVPEG